MQMSIGEYVATRWRYCCRCGDKPKIRKNELYFEESLYGAAGFSYRNFCVRCAMEEFQERIEFLQKKLKSIKVYTKVKEKQND